MNDKHKTQEVEKNSVETIIGVQIIQSIVEKVTSGIPPVTSIVAAIKQILYFYKLLPEEWKKKAFWIFEKLWNKHKVIISTDPEKPSKVYSVLFEDEELKKMFFLLSEADKSVLLLSQTMLNLINKGLHNESDQIKEEIKMKYGLRGLNMADIITTGDIQYLLDETKNKSDNEKIKIFDEWTKEYNRIAVLISPSILNDKEFTEKKIIDVAAKAKKEYVLIHLSGTINDATSLLNIVENLKTSQKLKFKECIPVFKEAGFCKTIEIKVIF